MLEQLQEKYRQITRGQPGQRFGDQYRRRRQNHEPAWKTPLYILLGLALMIIGLFASVPPGVPGFLLWIPGLALIVARLESFAVVLDRGEMLLRRLLGRTR
ncbi:MAG: hypothetical protein R3310_17010 [Candidatus Competibacteraceae bacterium]|nr:hypothetical protein [Candidatus Competibacteraceae bacterium]